MNIELRFLQKAIEDKNYISFSYKDKTYKRIKALKLIKTNDSYLLETNLEKFDSNKLIKLKILKEKF